jgi:hypothetical protein
MAENPAVVEDKFYFEMHGGRDMGDSVKVYSGKGVARGKTSLYYKKVGSDKNISSPT